MRLFQRLGKALMLPVACLPISGILMGLGYAIAPAAMGAAGASEGLAYVLGFFLIKAGGALIDNMALLFAVGVAVGLSQNGDGTAALAGLVSWLMITTILSGDVMTAIAPGMIADPVNAVAFAKVANPFTGILCGVIGAVCYNRFKDVKLPDVLAFFSGKRCVAIITGVVSAVAAAALMLIWPAIFGALVSVGRAIKGMGAIGVGLYAFLNRLLIPTGLHHALNNVFWFDTIGMGDLTAYWGALIEGSSMADGTVIDWSVGMYMAGFFPSMMGGVAGAAAAMIRCAKKERRRGAIGLVGAAAACAFLCGVTEPFEFSFMFLAFPLYVTYAVLYGVFAAASVALGFRAGFCFSAGLTDLVFSASLPAAANTWLIVPLGAAAFVCFYLVFRFAIMRWDLKTPGREDAQEIENETDTAGNDFTEMAGEILEGLGGKENLESVDHCVTRLRVEVKDSRLVDEKKMIASGCAGVIRPGKRSVQVIIGPKVQFVFDELKKLAK
ncbi:MAG: PTS transporter subunit EIIC [Clostridia bacterium]|nr:PTS transporter subunit EIIC [Clostridia bacterium]